MIMTTKAPCKVLTKTGLVNSLVQPVKFIKMLVWPTAELKKSAIM